MSESPEIVARTGTSLVYSWRGQRRTVVFASATPLEGYSEGEVQAWLNGYVAARDETARERAPDAKVNEAFERAVRV